MQPSRRKFIRQSSKMVVAGGLLSAFPAILPARGKAAPSDQLNLGLIGCRGRGFHVLQSHLALGNVNCVALCDVDEKVLGERAGTIAEEFGQKVKLYKDFRELIAQKDIDAVIIGTPDHWHCLPMVYACQEGKDVYVEKPLANTIAECNVMAEAARRYNRIVQVGQQQRSSEVWKGAMDYLKSGELGRLRKANVWGNFNYGLGPMKSPDQAAPEGVDYDLWLGPAPEKPFNPARFHGSWRFFWDYGGGLVTDWGVHLIDMALWAKDLATPPASVLAYGDQLPNPDRSRETFDTMSVIFPYDDYLIQWENNAGKQVGPYNQNYGIEFLCDKGTLVADRSGWRVFPEWDDQKKAPKTKELPKQEGKSGHELHCRDFVDSVKNRTTPACTVEMGRTAAVCTHLANIAVRTGDYKLDWDDAKNKFTNSREANRLITPEYRKPWKLPAL